MIRVLRKIRYFSFFFEIEVWEGKNILLVWFLTYTFPAAPLAH